MQKVHSSLFPVNKTAFFQVQEAIQNLYKLMLLKGDSGLHDCFPLLFKNNNIVVNICDHFFMYQKENIINSTYMSYQESKSDSLLLLIFTKENFIQLSPAF